MEIDRISEDIKFVNQIGQTLSIDERLKLEIALVKLSQTVECDQLLFWGRIEGITSNYYLAMTLTFKGYFEFPHKRFYWTTNNFVFQELIQINPYYADKIDTYRGMFAGQPDKILFQVEGQEEGGAPADGGQNEAGGQQEGAPVNDDDSDVEVKPPPKNLTELDRLAYVVLAIENDTALAPIGAFRLTPTHELRYNDSFKGLTAHEASFLKSYQHFKAPEHPEKKELIARSDALFHFNFFDPIELDTPKGVWSIQSDASRTNFTIRSLLWPGFLGYHKVNTRVFGYAYFGDGIKQVDLAFLL